MTQGPGARPGRAPEHADFEVARVGERGSRSLVRFLALGAVLVGMIAVAILNRPTTAPTTAGAAASGGLASLPVVSAAPDASSGAVSSFAFLGPAQTSDPSSTEIRLVAEPMTDAMFVHGDVFVPNVTWVFVSLQDASRAVVGWTSVSVPGAAGPAANGGPTMRFDVQVAVPPGTNQPLTVDANAYDSSGRMVGSTQLVVPTPGGPAAPAVARPPALGSVNPAAAVAPVTLRLPAGRWGEITGSSIPIDGKLAIYASELRISLENGLDPLDSVMLDTDPNGGLRWDTVPTFHVDLAIPSPRPIGQLWVEINAYDRTGSEVGSLRQAVVIAPAAVG